VLIIFAIAATWSDSVAASTEKSQCFASYSSETNELNIPCVVMRNQSGEDNFISGGVLLRLDTAHQNNMRFHMLPGTNPVSANNVMDSCTARMVAQENGGLQLSVPCIGQVDSPERYQAEFAGGPDNQERLILFAITEFANATDLSDSLPIVYLEENSTNSRSTQLRAAPTRIDAPVSGTGWRYVQHNPGGYYEGIAGANDGYSWDINWGSGSADEGKPVYAIEAGCIYNTGAWGGASFGQLLINHTTNNNNWSSGYLHMKNITSKKSNGGCVAKGEVIGYVSDVGKNVNPAISAPHLHFAVYNSHGKSYLQSVNVSINDPTTYPLAPPPTISLTSPNNGATNLPHPVVPLGWTVQNATNLRVVVSTSSSFSGFVDNGGSSSCSNNTTCWTWTWGAENTSPRFTVAQPGITYYWKVRANNSQTGLTSDWTPVRSFATQSAATPPSGGTTPPTSGTTTFSTGAYGNNENRTQTLSIPGATSLTVTVSGLTEQNYDFITVYDANGNQVRRLSGTLNTSFTVTGSSIRVQFTSDYSETRSGATVSIASR
jgi:hypothetical protein